MEPAERPDRELSPVAADLVAFGRQVVATEAEALVSLATALDDHFAAAVNLVLGLRGRLICTGIGKSGHVARKAAATFASTGSPAFFVHPAEAAHGDLGMVTADDALLAFSNSGTTAELLPLLQHAAKLGLSIIGIAANNDSPVMRHATIRLLLPKVDEACPANLAPTTSTSMMMALGDALAMTTMRERGVSRAGFEELHPGGAIGRRLMRVAAVMHRDEAMPIVRADALMRDVIVTMTTCSFGIAGVVNFEGTLIGAITDGDLRRHISNILDMPAHEVMTPNPIWCGPSWLIEDALALLNRQKITAMFVVEEDRARKPVGIVHVHDFLRLGLA
ncbi:arabinose-5-phosphate isomerase [Sphingomonas vulcanisoli]|uniref:Arabinose-5-phosphate isomerase n=1 Tax=Sphingomonas vulcanisoli TaxID=1658060 RepID=A0ABX0TWP3_9SPHN|nr:KpsF/GutQ family sugar-phosphate isomerase [Sphingomonas vulcanisoli]NIJ09468.1 arabinose-5-phosphate isomerase [Sphingomonas vulcanisoli]